MQEAFAFSTDELRRLPKSGSPCHQSYRFPAESSHPTSYLPGPTYGCDYNYCYACDSCKCCAGSPQHSNSSTPQQQTSSSPTPFVSAPSSPRQHVQLGGAHFYNREDGDVAHNYRSPQKQTSSVPQRFITDGDAATAAERDLYICREDQGVRSRGDGHAAAGEDDDEDAKKKKHQQRRSHGDEQSSMDIVVDFENSEFEFHASSAGRNREFSDGTMASVDFHDNPSILMMSPAPMLSLSLGNHLFCNNNNGGRIATAASGDEIDYCCTPAAAAAPDNRLRPLITPPFMSPIHAYSTNHSRSTIHDASANHASRNYCAYYAVDDRLGSDTLQMPRKPPHPSPSEISPVPASNRFLLGEVRQEYGSGDGVDTTGTAGSTSRKSSPGHRNSEPGVSAAGRNGGYAEIFTVKVEGQQRKPCACSLSSSSAAVAPAAAVSSSSSSTSPRFSAALRACISGCPSTTLGRNCGAGAGAGGNSPAAMSASTAAISSKSLHNKSRRPPPAISTPLSNRSRFPPHLHTLRDKSTTTGRWPAALCSSMALDSVLDAALHTAARCVPSGSESPAPPPLSVAVAPEAFSSSVSNPSTTSTSARTRCSHRRTTGRNFESTRPVLTSMFVRGRRRSDPPGAISSNSSQIQAQPDTDSDSNSTQQQEMQFMGGRVFCRDGDPQRKRLTLGDLLHVRQ